MGRVADTLPKLWKWLKSVKITIGKSKNPFYGPSSSDEGDRYEREYKWFKITWKW